MNWKVYWKVRTSTSMVCLQAFECGSMPVFVCIFVYMRVLPLFDAIEQPLHSET